MDRLSRSRPRRGGRRGRVSLGVGLLAIASGCVTVPVAPRPSAPPGPAAPEAGTGGCPATVGQSVLDRVNRIRTDHGLRPLAPHARLAAAAQRHAEDQAERNTISHTGADGSTSGERVERAGYAWTMVAENVGAGYPDPATVVAAWMTSPPHRSTILAPEPRDAGVGYAYRADGALHHFWTLDVARPGEPASAGSVACHP